MKLMRENLVPEDFQKISNNRDKLLFLIKLASFAPSSHNTQPWLFRLGEKRIDILPNFKRRLLASDPKDRQLYLSIGAAIGNLLMASEAYGLKMNLASGTLSSSVSIIYDDLKSETIDSSTLIALINRHNNRFPFQYKPVPAEFYKKILDICGAKNIVATIVNDVETKKEIQKIVEDATEDAFSDKGFTNELSQWIKPSLKKYRDGMPGYNIGIPFPLSFVLPWMIKHLNMSKSQRKMVTLQLEHATAYVVLSSDRDSKEGWLEIGETLERIVVEAENQGIKVGLLTAPIEIKNHYKRMQEILKIPSRPQTFFRIGYTDKVPKPSPRLDLKEILIS